MTYIICGECRGRIPFDSRRVVIQTWVGDSCTGSETVHQHCYNGTMTAHERRNLLHETAVRLRASMTPEKAAKRLGVSTDTIRYHVMGLCACGSTDRYRKPHALKKVAV